MDAQSDYSIKVVGVIIHPSPTTHNLGMFDSSFCFVSHMLSKFCFFQFCNIVLRPSSNFKDDETVVQEFVTVRLFFSPHYSSFTTIVLAPNHPFTLRFLFVGGINKCTVVCQRMER